MPRAPIVLTPSLFSLSLLFLHVLHASLDHRSPIVPSFSYVVKPCQLNYRRRTRRYAARCHNTVATRYIGITPRDLRLTTAFTTIAKSPRPIAAIRTEVSQIDARLKFERWILHAEYIYKRQFININGETCTFYAV